MVVKKRRAGCRFPARPADVSLPTTITTTGAQTFSYRAPTVCYLFLSFLFPFHGLFGIRDPDHGEERKEKTGKEKELNKRW